MSLLRSWFASTFHFCVLLFVCFIFLVAVVCLLGSLVGYIVVVLCLCVHVSPYCFFFFFFFC